MRDSAKVVAFDEHELDFGRSELRQREIPVDIQPTPLRLLLYLAEHRDRVVPRQELLDAIWPGVVVGDEALTTALAEARHAVGDDGAAQRVVRTYKGRGYRFVAEVVTLASEAAVAPGHRPALVREEAAVEAPARRWSRSRAPLAGVVLVLLAGFSWLGWKQWRIPILTRIALAAPRYFGDAIEQEIHFATTSDGVRIAYATTGSGPPILLTVGWGTHLVQGVFSRKLSLDFIERMSERNLFIRYDGRGFGLSQREVTDFSLDAKVRDIEAVADALELERFDLYASATGGPPAIAYAARHPERVKHLIFVGSSAGYASIPPSELGTAQARTVAAGDWVKMLEVVRTSWDNRAVRDMFGRFLFPEDDPVKQSIRSELLRVSADGPALAGFFTVTIDEDVSALARNLRTPTLVIHGERDTSVPLAFGVKLASLIPGARLEIIQDAEHEPNIDAAVELIKDFVATPE
jgi:pimeloyl-ACP methyl ester carboxylesterase/DNA-binding winged helix-turn-helix (wHTH) protein